MYCEKCGTKKINGQCPNCDHKKTILNATYNIYVFILTIATLLIIRFSSVESRTIATPNSWKGRYGIEHYVPGNMKGVMIVLLCVSAFILFNMSQNNAQHRKKTLFMLIAEIIIGLLIIFVKTS